MWKIVKSELKYIGTELIRCRYYYLIGVFIYTIYAYFMILEGKNLHCLDNKDESIIYFLSFIRFIWGFLPFLFGVFQIHLLVRDINESKLKNHIVLPIHLKAVAISRILTLFIMFIAFCMLYIMFGLLYNYLTPDNLVLLAPYDMFARESILHINTSLTNPHLWFLLPFSFSIKLLNEGKRKIFGIIFLSALLFYVFLYMADYSNSKSIYRFIIEKTWKPAGAIWLCIAFSISIYKSTMTRKSYLK